MPWLMGLASFNLGKLLECPRSSRKIKTFQPNKNHILLTETATSDVSNSETENLAMHNSGTNFAQMAS